MGTPQPGTPPISPDGHYWWDGQAWQPIPAASAAIAAPAPAAAEQPPSWLAVPPAVAVAPAPQPAYPQPVYDQPAASDVPSWSTPGPPPRRTGIYLTGLLLIAVIAIGGFFVYGQLNPSSNNVAAVQVSPSPLISDYERADRFLNVDLGPALVEVNQAGPAVTAKCTSALPPGCRDALVTLNKAMLDLDTAMTNNQRDVPICIGRQVQQFKDDWRGMEQGVSEAIQGFDQSNRTLTLTGLQQFAAIGQYLKPDVDRISKAEQGCSKTL
jgi:hypothetical protein